MACKKNQKTNKLERECFYCHQIGHIISICPEIIKKNNRADIKNKEETFVNELYTKYGPTWYYIVDGTPEDSKIAKNNRNKMNIIIEKNNKKIDDKIIKYTNKQKNNADEISIDKSILEIQQLFKQLTYKESILRQEYYKNGWKWNKWSMIA
jgi:hypothetical protein